MAIPISWPVSEDTELDLLLEHLIIAINQIANLRRMRRLRRMQNNSHHRQWHEPGPPPPNNGPVNSPQIPNNLVSSPSSPAEPSVVNNNTEPVSPASSPSTPENQDSTTNLPDLLTDIADCRNQQQQQQQKPPSIQNATESMSWMQTGADLRHIADAFEQLRTPEETNGLDGNKTKKNCNLVTALYPMLVNSLWPVLAFAVGWNLLTRTR